VIGKKVARYPPQPKLLGRFGSNFLQNIISCVYFPLSTSFLNFLLEAMLWGQNRGTTCQALGAKNQKKKFFFDFGHYFDGFS